MHAGSIAGAVATLFAASYGPVTLANPTGGQVVSGNVNISSPGAGQMNIAQGSNNAIVNWNTFSIGANEAVSIAQPSTTSALLNRVMGNDQSVIAGRLQANGKVFLVNPAGVIFARGSSVNVGSMVASTLNITDTDFLAGNYHFVGKSVAPVSNAGSITAGSGGTVALLGGTVSNSGTVAARLGTVALGAGQDITVDFAGDGLTTLKINQGAAGALIGNTGTLAADGGVVVMSAQTADALAGTVINQQGIVRAQSLVERDGHIILDGGTSGVTQVGGTLDATGGTGLKGGQVDVTGYNVALMDGARVDASGAVGGGAVRFGGGAAGADPSIRNANAVWMAPTASMRADALANGNGGSLIAFAGTASRLYGTLSAKGGAQGGDGGTIETSGYFLDTAGATIDASARQGKSGTWTLDPANIDVVGGAPGNEVPAAETLGNNGVPTVFTPGAGNSFVVGSAIDTQLNAGTSVRIVTSAGQAGAGDGSINVLTRIVKSEGGDAVLTLSAVGSIAVTQNIISTAGKLGLVFDANVGNGTSGHIIQVQGTTDGRVMLTTNGGDVTMGVKEGLPGSFDGAAVQLAYADISTLTGASTTAPSGSVTIHGQAPGAKTLAPVVDGAFTTSVADLAGVGVFSSGIATTNGSIELASTLGSGTTLPVDGVLVASVVIPEAGGVPDVISRSSLTSGSGAIRLFGVGTDTTHNANYDVAGVQVWQASTIQSGTGSIEIRGNLQGTRVPVNTDIDSGVDLGTSTISAPGQNSSLIITGSTNSDSPGLFMSPFQGGLVAAGPNLSVGQNGTIVLRGSNDGSTDAFQVARNTNPPQTVPSFTTLSSGGGTIVLATGAVNPQDFSVTSVATPIGLNNALPGFSIDATSLQAFAGSEGITNIVVGSSAQTGRITFSPTGAGTPTFANNLTLEAAGGGSQGISLPSGISILNNGVLTLSSVGTVTQNGPIQAAGLLLSGPGTFTLTNPQNAVQRLSTADIANATFVNSTNLSIAGLTGLGFNMTTGQTETIGNLGGSTLAGSLTASTTTGDITVSAPIQKDAGSDGTLTLSAAGNIGDTANITSNAGKLNIVLDANAGNSVSGHEIDVYAHENTQTDRITRTLLSTNGGDLSIGVQAGQPGSFDGAAVQLAAVDLNTTVPGGAAASGSVTIHGQAPGATPFQGIFAKAGAVQSVPDVYAVALLGSSITTSSGAIELAGNVGTGTGNPVGGVLIDPVTSVTGGGTAVTRSQFLSSLTTGTGAISIFGIGTHLGDASKYDVSGVKISGGSSVVSGGRLVDIRGGLVGTQNPANISQDSGVKLVSSEIDASGATSEVSVTGSSNSASPGILLSSLIDGVESGGAALSVGEHGTIVLSASNNSESDSFQRVGTFSTNSTGDGTLVVTPGKVDIQNFNVTAADATLINLNSTAPGLSIDATSLGILANPSAGFSNVVFGSTSQTGKITFDPSSANARPAFSVNLTLAAGGPGSQGIDLPSGLSMPGHALTLVSGGPVTDPGGITAAGLLLYGPGMFTLIDPQNAVGVLAMANAGTVDFLNSGGFTIGPLSGVAYDSSMRQVTGIDGTRSTVTGKLTAQAATGNLALATTLSAGDHVDLTMENGVFNAGPSGALSAANGWRIWANTWKGESRGSVQPDAVQPNWYGCVFGAGCSWGGTVPGTGDHYAYVERPTVTVTADGKTRVYGAPNPPFTVTVSGLVNGDSETSALGEQIQSPATESSLPGQYPIVPKFTSGIGYIVDNIPGVLNIIPPGEMPVDNSGLQTFFTDREQTFVYENNLQGTGICIGASQPLFTGVAPGDKQDILAIEWKRVRSQPNLNSCLVTTTQHGCDDF